MQYNVISADNHIVEPRELFATRLPAEFRDRAPRVMRGADGGDGWSWDGKTVERTFGIEAIAGREIVASGYKWEEILPGNYDGAAHLKDMLDEGVDAGVIFSNMAMSAWLMQDDPFALAMIRAFNDWLMEDFCAPDRKRLLGLPMLPINHGVEASIAEAERTLKMGARGWHIPVYPDVAWVDPSYEPLWAFAAQAGAPLCMHRASGAKDPSGAGFAYKTPGVALATSVTRFFAGVDPLAKLIFTGVFHRHPALKVIHAEINFGWAPFWRNTLEEVYDRQKGWAKPPFEGRPSDPLGRNIFVTVLDDKLGFELIEREPWLADMAMFSTDYPHSFCLWPDTKGYIDKLTEGVEPAAKHKVLAGNAVRAFGLN